MVEYLLEKGFVKRGTPKGAKYRVSVPSDWPATPLPPSDIQWVDVWLASSDVPSTVGTPTVDNSGEYIDLATQLGYVTKAKRNWTATGQAVTRLRERQQVANPFVLRDDALLAFRQLLGSDGLMIESLLRHLSASSGQIRRDEVAAEAFLPMCEETLVRARSLRYPPRDVSELRDLVNTVQRTAAKRAQSSSGPGVLEHRITPRLEWLVDLRLLEKDGPRNSFTYEASKILGATAEAVNELDPRSADDVDERALAWWRLREATAATDERRDPPASRRDALRTAYEVTKRPIGPAAIRETVLLAAAWRKDSLRDMRAELLDWAHDDPKVTLSGGRYSRAPELVYVAP